MTMSLLPVVCMAIGVLAVLGAPPVRSLSVQRSRCIVSDVPAPCGLVSRAQPDQWAEEERPTVLLRFTDVCAQNPSTGTAAQHSALYAQLISRPEAVDPTLLLGGALVIDLPEPGSELLNVTLVSIADQLDGSTSTTVQDWLLVCVDFIPDYRERVYNSASDTHQCASAGNLPAAELHAVANGLAPKGCSFDASTRNSHGQTERTTEETDIKPLRILYVGNILGAHYDGMKAVHLAHMRYQPQHLCKPAHLDLSCSVRTHPDVTEWTADIPGLVQHHRCLRCPLELCTAETDFFDFLSSTLPTLSSFSQLPEAWRSVLEPLASVLRHADAILMGANVPKDDYILHLARLVNPHVVRFGDLGAQAGLARRETASRLPFDAFVVPSMFVGMYPQVVKDRVPTYLIPPSVDTVKLFNSSAVFSPSSHLDHPLPPAFCAGEYRARMCEHGNVDASARTHSWCTQSPAQSQSPLVFGFVARLSPEKGVGMFIVAAALVSLHLPHARFVIVGRSTRKEYLAGLRHLIDRYRLTDKVLLVGFVAPADLPRMFTCFDVFVASYMRETFALTNVEAMAMGIPFVHFGIGGIRDYGRHLVNSIVAESRDASALAEAMATLGLNATLRQELGRSGRATAAGVYDAAKVGTHGAEVFRRAVAASRAVASVDLVSATVIVDGIWNQRHDGQESATEAGDSVHVSFMHSCVVRADERGMVMCERAEQHFGVHAPRDDIIEQGATSDRGTLTSFRIPRPVHQEYEEFAQQSSPCLTRWHASLSMPQAQLHLRARLVVDVRGVPQGFDDVWRAVAAEKPAADGFDQETEPTASSSAAAQRLFVEWHGARSVVCVLYEVTNSSGQSITGVQRACSPSVTSVVQLERVCTPLNTTFADAAIDPKGGVHGGEPKNTTSSSCWLEPRVSLAIAAPIQVPILHALPTCTELASTGCASQDTRSNCCTRCVNHSSTNSQEAGCRPVLSLAIDELRIRAQITVRDYQDESIVHAFSDLSA